jgi:hypothetical protein
LLIKIFPGLLWIGFYLVNRDAVHTGDGFDNSIFQMTTAGLEIGIDTLQ